MSNMSELRDKVLNFNFQLVSNMLVLTDMLESMPCVAVCIYYSKQFIIHMMSHNEC